MPRSAKSDLVDQVSGERLDSGGSHSALLERYRALENTVRQLAQEAPFGLHTLNRDATYLTVNHRELSWLGYTVDELVGKIKFTELLIPDDRQKFMALLAASLLSNRIKDHDIKLVSKSGLVESFKIYVKAIPHQDNTLSHYECMLFAYSDRQQVEEKLRIAATVFESIEGMMVTDYSGIILNVNRTFTNITGYSADEAIGRRPCMLSSGRHDKAFYAAMWSDLNNQHFWEGEIWNRRKNGEIYPEHLTITAVRSPEGIVTNYVGVFGDITERKIAADRIEHLAFYDSLTGLPNRRLLLDRLQHAMEGAERHGKEGAVLYIDLDQFKNINNTLGHDIGDLLLTMVAKRLTTCVRKGDTVARIGGDEFVVILEDLGDQELEAAAQVKAICKKILSTLNQVYILGEHHSHNSPSIGVAMFADCEKSIEDVLKQADLAMYQAKKSGRNSMCFFDPLMQSGLNARVALEQDLHDAIVGDQFLLYYQIQVNDISGPDGVEGLIRWQHPVRGLLLPNQFIPLAEETGAILPIGLWVLKSACAQIRKWDSALPSRDLVLSVNVSAKQFRQDDFVDQVLTAVHEHQINPKRLKLEITESMFLEDVENTIAKMNILRRAGISFSLDDFGTGYSSLQYLKRLPLDQIKIDQSFIHNLTTDANDRAIVATIIAMSNSLHLNVIAEGVETESQQQYLKEEGCHNYQGYLFSKPLPIEDFEKHYLPKI